MNESLNVTALLVAWREGDEAALDRLSPLLYGELRQLAGAYMALEAPGHTLQATALVNEAFVRLVDADVDYRDRRHFFALAARMMRRILVDHARSRERDKRGGGVVALTFDDALHVPEGRADATSVLELDEALSRLGEIDARMVEAVELIFFGGFTYEEVAEMLGVSRTVLFEDVRFARAWLKRAMS
ncbi:MAG: ECF-type sigma factor [Pseudomonadales bacterium]|nr:ECF-type sigma factor [Pseudomonadales bacterium]